MTVRERTGLTDEQIDNTLRWYARQPRKVQLECADERQLAELVVKARELKLLSEEGRTKRYSRDLDSLSNAEKIHIMQLEAERKKPSPKARAIEKHRALIRRLLRQGVSWRTIAAYLDKHANIKISASYLRRLWLKWEENGMV